MTYTHKAVCPHLVSVIHNHSFNCLFVNEPKIVRTTYFFDSVQRYKLYFQMTTKIASIFANILILKYLFFQIFSTLVAVNKIQA